MTRLDTGGEASDELVERPPRSDGPRALLLQSREVPLGGVRAMAVHRSLPQRDLPMVGAWCFLDRFGPQVTRMRVEPHPHIGLQTVTWPFVGEVRHRDSLGSDVVVRSGALNLMTSGEGIAHSEYSVGEGEVPLDALQLWVALPDSRRHGEPAFERHEELPIVELAATIGQDAGAIVVMGEFAGAISPATAHTPIAGAEVRLAAGSTVRVPLRHDWEYALLGVEGDLTIETGGATADAASAVLNAGELLYLGLDRDGVTVSTAGGATVFVLGGEPFPDEIVMWWNFVGRSHDEIVAAREAWEAGAERFGRVEGHGEVRIPAPPLPGVRLTPRRRRV